MRTEFKRLRMNSGVYDVCFFVRRPMCVEKKTKLDSTECFIALKICSTCFGHLYAHHQELETILVYYRMWCVMPWMMVVGF